MQLQQLRYMVCVAEEKRFTRAAARLHVAQPSISSAVAALEQELGATLFHRDRSEVTLTGAGEVFLPWARQVLADCDAGAAAVRDLLGLERGRLVIGATPSLTTNLLPPVLSRFHVDHPGVEMTLHEAGSQELVERLSRGEMDLAVVILPVDRPSVQADALMQEELVLAVNRSHPLAHRRVIRVNELETVPLVMFKDGYDLREATLAACRQAGFVPVMAMQGLEMDGALALAAAGVAAAVVPGSVVAATGPLKAIRFRGASLQRTIGLASRRDRPLSPSAAVFVDALRRHMEKLHADQESARAT
ncbi:MAG: LysR family transcriptional regulator [Acidobacteriota bacterium]|nr:LysR family transcriptional regulator [Acidobacteriota bacterium]